jgi:hypothetical protein
MAAQRREVRMKQTWHNNESQLTSQSTDGLVGWLFNRIRHKPRPQPRLAVLERIVLAPRHSLALIEADGCRLLVATSQDGASAFYALDGSQSSMAASRRTAICASPARVSC